MKDNMKIFTDTIKRSFEQMKSWKLLITMGLDAVMIFLAFLFGDLFFRAILIRFDIISEVLQNNPEILTMSLSAIPSEQYSVLLGNLKSVGFLLLAYFLVLFLLYVIFQGVNWFIEIKKKDKKISYFDFIKRFKIVTGMYLLIFIIFTGISFYISAKTLFAIESEVAQIFRLASGVLFFFLTVSTAYVSKFKAWESIKRSFRFNMDFLMIFISLVFFGLIFILIDLLLKATWYIAPVINLALGILLLLLMLSYMRIHLINTVRKIK